jgi:ferric-dicitrate binding protein FerR (iron transport regulator)
VSKERARKRAARAAESARKVAAAESRNERQIAAGRRKARRAAALRSVTPSGQRFSRRTREQRAITVVLLLAVAVGAYVLLDSWAPRIGVLLLALIATPAIVTMILDRSSR